MLLREGLEADEMHPLLCRYPGYCASSGEIGSSRSYCTKRAFGANFQPAAVLLEDIPTKYASALNSTLPDTVFTADDYLGRFTTGAVRLPSQLFLISQKLTLTFGISSNHRTTSSLSEPLL